MPGVFAEFVVTCSSWQEAQAITDVLLEKHLVACVEMVDVKSKYRRQGRLEEAREIKLVMESRADNFEQIEAEVRKLHGYETFALQQLPLSRLSGAAAEWLAAETRQDN
jgi:periplasmic divalent cation tolerance protein